MIVEQALRHGVALPRALRVPEDIDEALRADWIGEAALARLVRLLAPLEGPRLSLGCAADGTAISGESPPISG